MKPMPLLAVLVVTLGGCAAPGPGAWTKPTVDAREQRRDAYECARHATFTAETRQDRAAAFAACMRARGYEAVQDR